MQKSIQNPPSFHTETTRQGVKCSNTQKSTHQTHNKQYTHEATYPEYHQMWHAHDPGDKNNESNQYKCTDKT